MPKRLSRRERQVVEGIAAGRTTKEIAGLLGIRPSTVDWHIANALAKLQAANRAQAVAIVLRRGDLAPGRAERLLARAMWMADRWRALAAAILIAVAMPMLVASDTGPGALPSGAPSSPTAETTPIASDRRVVPEASAPATPVASAMVPLTTAVPSAEPTLDRAASPVSPRLIRTSAPATATPAGPIATSPVPTVIPTASLLVSPLPIATLAPSLAPSLSPLPSLTPPPTSSTLPTLPTLPTLLPTATEVPRLIPLPTAPPLPSAPATSPLPSLP